MDPEQTVIELVGNMSCLQLPIGVYVVAPDGRFIAANKPLRALLQLPLHGPLDASIADFYAEPERREHLVARVLDGEERGKFLEKELVQLCVDGADVFVECFCKPLRDLTTHELIGFVGCLVDISAEHEAELQQVELQQKVQELTSDIGRVLHANTTTLIMGQQTLDAVEEVLR
ncbi:MAG TPA: PAS domain-containing protein, partial [Roseiflexaceae bacterium]|nr:PAS domain-containing protein [Roseiflexaceae bacterium]